MAKLSPDEKWKEIELEFDLSYRYAVSNKGRVMSFTESFKDGRVLRGSLVEGYRVLRFKITQRKRKINKHLFIHRLVAEAFIPNRSKSKTYVLHLDFKKVNNEIANLKWASKEEMIDHNKLSPAVVKARKKLIEHNRKRDGMKLTVEKARELKHTILSSRRKQTYKQIAQEYGVSEMTIYRIKSGNIWSHLK